MTFPSSRTARDGSTSSTAGRQNHACTPSSSQPLLLFGPIATAVELTIAFQIANPADSGTPHSTNAAVSLFNTRTGQGRLAMSKVGRAYGAGAPAVRGQEGWTVYSQTATQQGAAYTIVDAVREAADVTASIRFAWPALPGNPVHYDESMLAAMHTLVCLQLSRLRLWF